VETKEKILITLATGTTGYEITKELLKEGYPVRIYVRSGNKRANALENLGAEISLGEFNNYQQLKDALSGIKTVYYCYPIMKGMPAAVEIFIEAAKATGVEAVVFMGQWLAEFDNQESLLTNDIKKAYQLLERSGLNVVYYTPVFFADNLIAFTESIVQLGQMPSPFGDGKCPWISTGDLARTAVALLKNPFPYIGKKVHPTGPESIGAKQMANVYSKVTGRKVKLMPVSDNMFMKAMMAASDEFGYNAFMAVQTTFYIQELRKNRFAESAPTDVVKKLTGTEAEDFESIARDFINHSPYNKSSFSGKVHALKNLMKIIFAKVPGRSEQEALNSNQ
jgi:uncharacterized protein YbjT (DUF2867 family)